MGGAPRHPVQAFFSMFHDRCGLMVTVTCAKVDRFRDDIAQALSARPERLVGDNRQAQRVLRRLPMLRPQPSAMAGLFWPEVPKRFPCYRLKVVAFTPATPHASDGLLFWSGLFS